MPGALRTRIRAAMVIGALVAIGWLLWSSREALYPFVVGAIVVFALAPVVDWVALRLPGRDRFPHLMAGLAVFYVYTMAIALLALVAVQLIPRFLDQARDFIGDVPAFVAQVRDRAERGSTWYQEHVPPTVQGQINQSSQEIARRAANIGVDLLNRSVSIVSGGARGILAYIVVPFWVFYVLKDRDRGARAFYGLFPPALRGDVQTLTRRANDVLGSYIRAQLLLATVSAVVVGGGLTLLDVRFSLVLGVLAGIANLIPVLGPMIGGIPALLVTAATRPGWAVLWVFLFLFVVQNLKAYILVPRVHGQVVNIHPAIILVLLVVAGQVAGFWGLLVAVPLAAVVRDVFVFVYRRLGEERTALLVPAANDGEPAEDGRALTAASGRPRPG